MNDLIIQNIQELILPKSTDKPLKRESWTN